MKLKRKFESLITIHGEILNSNCPECDGEGVFLDDYTNASGGEMIPRLCGYCDGDGVITEDKVDAVNYDKEGQPHIIYKNK